MALPDVSLTIADPAIGIALPDTSRQIAKAGVCSGGTANTVYTFGDSRALVAALGTGPLVDAALDTLLQTGQPVVCVKVASDVAASIGSVTQVGTGTGVAALTGSALDAYDVIIKIVTGGTNLAALPTLQISLDGGRSYGPVLTAAASYVIPGTGMTLGLTNGSGTSWVAGDTYSFTVTAPGFSSSNLVTALTALLADASEWFACHIVGQAASVSAAATLFATLDALAATMEAGKRYAFFIQECPDDTDANIKSSFTALASSSKRMMVAAGFCAYASKSAPGNLFKRSAAWPIATRLARIPAGQEAGWVGGGSLPGVTLPAGFRDERATPGLDAINLATLRTFIGTGGVFVTNGKMKSSLLSDYQYATYRRVMDIACRAVNAAALPYVNSSVRVNPAGTPNAGKILEADARTIDAAVGQALSDAVVATGQASASQVVTSRTDNILATGLLNIQARVTPLGYGRSIAVDIGFTNPALAQ